jgi:Secretion system C-terminal sorting domain
MFRLTVFFLLLVGLMPNGLVGQSADSYTGGLSVQSAPTTGNWVEIARQESIVLYSQALVPGPASRVSEAKAQPETKTELEQNYPNPFASVTYITFQLAQAGEVKLRIYNLLGQPVATLKSGWLEAARHKVEWNASQVPPGIYFCQLSSATGVLTKKMTVSR